MSSVSERSNTLPSSSRNATDEMAVAFRCIQMWWRVRLRLDLSPAVQHVIYVQDAHAIVDYLHALGISDCYASSYLTAILAALTVTMSLTPPAQP
jgi:hypothetical protein